MNKQSGSAHVIIIAALVVALIGTLGFVFWQNVLNKKTVDSAQTSSSQTKSTDASLSAGSANASLDSTAAQQAAKTGSISGTAIYPSDGYPSDFKVCALNASSKAEIVCDNSMAGKAGKLDYKMSITPGTYLMQAKTGQMTGNYDGYMQGNNMYTAGIDLCDAKYHTPLEITVAADQTVSSINVGDFYYQPLNCK